MAQPVLCIRGMNVSLYQAAAALNANAKWQDVISQNLASSSIPGYRRQELTTEATQAGLLSGSGSNSQYFSLPKTTTGTSFATGDTQFTGNKNDVAIEGTGFFEVQLPNGTTAMTRDGEFQVNSKGQLVTKEGYPVMGDSGAIQLDIHSGSALSISSSGEITQGEQTRGKLKLTDYDKPGQLTQIGGSYFLANSKSLHATTATGTLRQGYLEGSNTSTVREMANMITAMRSFEANQHVVQIQDDRLGKTISDLAGTN